MERAKLMSYLVVLILLICTDCKDKFSFQGADSTGTLIVDATITDTPGPYVLKLGVTNGAANSQAALPGAKITMTDGSGRTENYVETGNGRYQLAGTVIHGTPGEKYKLDIFVNNKHYQSSQEAMPAVVAKDSAWFEVVDITVVSSEGVPVKNQVVQVFFDATLPAKDVDSHFRWSIEEVYRFAPLCIPNPFNTCPEPCYITQKYSKSNLTLVKGADFAARNLDDILIQQRDIDFTFLLKHYFNVQQFSMNQGAYEYWQKVQTLVARTGSLFDTPPANLQGNIRNVDDPAEIVNGYFEASRIHVNHVGVARGYIRGQLYDPCQFQPGIGRAYTPECVNCLSVEGSTKTQPDWFE